MRRTLCVVRYNSVNAKTAPIDRRRTLSRLFRTPQRNCYVGSFGKLEKMCAVRFYILRLAQLVDVQVGPLIGRPSFISRARCGRRASTREKCILLRSTVKPFAEDATPSYGEYQSSTRRYEDRLNNTTAIALVLLPPGSTNFPRRRGSHVNILSFLGHAADQHFSEFSLFHMVSEWDRVQFAGFLRRIVGILTLQRCGSRCTVRTYFCRIKAHKATSVVLSTARIHFVYRALPPFGEICIHFHPTASSP